MPRLPSSPADLAALMVRPLMVPKPGPEVSFGEIPGRSEELTIATRHGRVPTRLYLPPNDVSRARGVYVNFHGGGYVIGHPEQDDPWCRYLAAHAGVAVLNVDYAIAPEHRFPTPIEQGIDIVCWAASERERWDGTRLAIGGQSAGGGVTAGVARLALRSDATPEIALQVLHYPPLDLVTKIADKHTPLDKPVIRPWMSHVLDKAYVPDEARRKDPLVSPGWKDNGEGIEGIAPAVVITCALDSLHDEAVHYANALDRVGALREHIDLPDVDHAYNLLGTDRELTESVYRALVGHVTNAFDSSS